MSSQVPLLHTNKEYDELGDQFEDREKEMLGDKGFEHAAP